MRRTYRRIAIAFIAVLTAAVFIAPALAGPGAGPQQHQGSEQSEDPPRGKSHGAPHGKSDTAPHGEAKGTYPPSDRGCNPPGGGHGKGKSPQHDCDDPDDD